MNIPISAHGAVHLIVVRSQGQAGKNAAREIPIGLHGNQLQHIEGNEGSHTFKQKTTCLPHIPLQEAHLTSEVTFTDLKGRGDGSCPNCRFSLPPGGHTLYILGGGKP